MANIYFNLKHKEVLDSILLELPGVVPGKMFGYPAYYVEGKLFACVYEEGVGLKVPEKMAEDLIGREGISYFQPMGRRRMKEWIQIDRASSDEYLKDRGIFEISLRFVSSLSKRR